MADAETLSFIGQNSKLDVAGVLFSGILIASLGAVMDVSMSIASTVSELHHHSPQMGWWKLYRSGIHVGKDMMGTMSNTLILAFAGGSINTLLMIYAYNMAYLEFMNQYFIGIELLQGISGSLGVILTVPFVSIISAFLWQTERSKTRQMKQKPKSADRNGIISTSIQILLPQYLYMIMEASEK